MLSKLETELYHGSTEKFEQFSLDHLGKNGRAQGLGVYLTPNIDIAAMYTGVSEFEDRKGYLYTVFTALENSLSLNEITLSREELSDIVDELHEQSNFLDNYGDVHYSGYDQVHDEALELLLNSNNSDVDLLNDLAQTVGSNELVAEVFYKVGGYTHAVAYKQTRLCDDVVIVFNPARVTIWKVDEITNETM